MRRHSVSLAGIFVFATGGFLALLPWRMPSRAADPVPNQSQRDLPVGKQVLQLAQQPNRAPSKSNGPAAAKTTSDEEQIRAGAAEFTEAYNAHDSKRLAALFTPDAEVIDSDHRVVKGREAIKAAFETVFANHPEASTEVRVDEVRVLTANLAIEEGEVRSRLSPDEPEEISSYVAIHTPVDGKWRLTCVRDWEQPGPQATPQEQLQQLAWLVGDWVEESRESVVHTHCDWQDGGNFLVQKFDLHVGGKIGISGTMRIGWDAVRKQFKSWVFDSNGGYMEGYWTRDGDQWIVKSQGATALGQPASLTTVYVPIDAETMTWGAGNRVIDGQSQPDIAAIIVKRRPPAPSE